MLVFVSINHLSSVYLSAPVQSGYSERLQADRLEKPNRNAVHSNHAAWKKQCDANPAIVNFFLSLETDADISIYSFSSFRLLVKSLLVAKQQ